jgi:hypothetical protein
MKIMANDKSCQRFNEVYQLRNEDAPGSRIGGPTLDRWQEFRREVEAKTMKESDIRPDCSNILRTGHRWPEFNPAEHCSNIVSGLKNAEHRP